MFPGWPGWAIALIAAAVIIPLVTARVMRRR